MQRKRLLVQPGLHWHGFSLCVCSLDVSLCPCCKPPLASSPKFCTSFVLIMTSESSQSLAFSYPLDIWKLLTLSCVLLWLLALGEPVEGLYTSLPFAALLWPPPPGLRFSDLFPNTKLLCSGLSDFGSPPTSNYLRFLDISHAPSPLPHETQGSREYWVPEKGPKQQIYHSLIPLKFLQKDIPCHEGFLTTSLWREMLPPISGLMSALHSWAYWKVLWPQCPKIASEYSLSSLWGTKERPVFSLRCLGS